MKNNKHKEINNLIKIINSIIDENIRKSEDDFLNKKKIIIIK